MRGTSLPCNEAVRMHLVNVQRMERQPQTLQSAVTLPLDRTDSCGLTWRSLRPGGGMAARRGRHEA